MTVNRRQVGWPRPRSSCLLAGVFVLRHVNYTSIVAAGQEKNVAFLGLLSRVRRGDYFCPVRCVIGPAHTLTCAPESTRNAAGNPPENRPWCATFFAGVVTTYQTLDYQIDAQAKYQDNTEADGVEFGDLAEVDASLQYRIFPSELGGGGVPDFLYAVLEANLVQQDKTRIDGNEDPDSGGTSLFLAPGLQYVTTRWILETAVQVPVVQNLNGDALETGFILRAGFRVNI